MSRAEHNLIRIGQVLKSNGTDGEVVMGFRDIDPVDIDLEEPVFIRLDGTPVPFFIESFTLRGNSKAIVRLTDIRSGADAEEITGHPVYAEAESLGEEYPDEDDLSFLTGWTLYNARTDNDGGNGTGDRNGMGQASQREKVGEVTDFLDIPGNPCIVAETKKGAVTIPLHEDLIISTDPGFRSITMEIPDGLLSL